VAKRCQVSSVDASLPLWDPHACINLALYLQVYPSSWLKLSCVQDGGKVRYEPAAQSCMQHLGAPERPEPRDVGFSLTISALTFIYKAKLIRAPFTDMEFISEIP